MSLLVNGLPQNIILRWGGNSSGRYKFRVNKTGSWQTVFNLTRATYDTGGSQPSTFWGWNCHKQYHALKAVVDHIRNNGGKAIIYWDDWELWSGDATGTTSPPPPPPPPPGSSPEDHQSECRKLLCAAKWQ